MRNIRVINVFILVGATKMRRTKLVVSVFKKKLHFCMAHMKKPMNLSSSIPIIL